MKLLLPPLIALSALVLSAAAPAPAQPELYKLGSYCEGPGAAERCAELTSPAMPAPITAARQACPSGGQRGCEALVAAAQAWIQDNRFKTPRDEAGLRAANFAIFYGRDHAAAAAEKTAPMGQAQCLHQDLIFDTIYDHGRNQKRPGAEAMVTPASNKVRECRMLYSTIAQPTDLPASGADAVGRTCWITEEIRSCPAGMTINQPAMKVGSPCTCFGQGGKPGTIRR